MSDLVLDKQQKSLVVSHFLNHRSPQVVFKRLFPSSPPVSLPQFQKLYVDAVIEFITPVGDNARVALDPKMSKLVDVLYSVIDSLKNAIDDVAENPQGPPDDKGRCEDRIRMIAGLAQALASIVKQIREIRRDQIQETAALHQLIMSNAGADDGET